MARPPTPELSSSPHPPRPKVIYIMGAGRSGSTILGVTLGNCEDVFFAGEVDKWLLHSGKPTQLDSERTRFWDVVRERVEDPEPLFGSAAHHCLERSSSLFRVRARSVRRRMRARYRRLTEELYRAIAVTAGVTHVVDSSHYPLRARELQALEGIDLHLVLLVRDPRSVLASFAREDVTEPRFNALKTNAYLWLTNLLSVWVFLKHPSERRLLLRHEDFLADPEGVLGSVLEHVGSPSPIPDLTSLSTGLPLQGNRLIAEKVVSLERRGSSSPRASALKSLPQLPWTVVFSWLRPRAAAGRSTPLASASAPARL
jgi:Sulfotransferase family